VETDSEALTELSTTNELDYQLGLSDVSDGDFYLLKHKITTCSVRAWRQCQAGDEAMGDCSP